MIARRAVLGLFLLIVVFGVVFYFTWQSIEQGQRSGTWSYSQLFREADAGRVARIDIYGPSAVATDRNGQHYDVTLSGDTAGDARKLAADGVNVTFHQTGSGAYWLQVLVPNLILLVLLGGVILWVARARR